VNVQAAAELDVGTPAVEWSAEAVIVNIENIT
jgi:hypothetical protein